MLVYFSGNLLDLWSISKEEDHTLLVVCNCLFNILAATFHIFKLSPSICNL